MTEQSPESNVIRADFRGHRRQIARQNSPFGPVIAGMVEVKIPDADEFFVTQLMADALEIVGQEARRRKEAEQA